jgi:hypothetical protein
LQPTTGIVSQTCQVRKSAGNDIEQMPQGVQSYPMVLLSWWNGILEPG